MKPLTSNQTLFSESKSSSNISFSQPQAIIQDINVNNLEKLSGSMIKPNSTLSSLFPKPLTTIAPILLEGNTCCNINKEFVKTSLIKVMGSKTREYAKGKSFNFMGMWAENTHYNNDDYVTDFVVYDGCVLACRISHLSSQFDTFEFVYDEYGTAVDLKSDLWEFVLPGSTRLLYVPVYNSETHTLTWELSQDPTATSGIDFESLFRELYGDTVIRPQEVITENSTHTDIPSSKAVYDLVKVSGDKFFRHSQMTASDT